MLSVLFAALAALLPITNPIGALAGFAGLTSDMPKEQVRQQAVRTALYVFLILAVFALVGGLLLSALGISLPSLQIAGGIVVAHSGFAMLSAKPTTTPKEDEHAAQKDDISFSPMALPLIAGPGSIGVIIALQARFPGFLNGLGLVLAALVLSVLIGLILRFGTPLIDRLGPTGIGALTRVMGFLILAIGVELVVHGVHAAGF